MNKTKARSATVKTFPQFLRRQCGQPSGARRFRLNAAGGGLLRDVLVRDEPLLFKPGQFYVLAGFVGCLLFTLLVVQLKTDATLAAVITIVVTFALRVLAIQFNWKSPPLWREPEPALASAREQKASPPHSKQS